MKNLILLALLLFTTSLKSQIVLQDEREFGENEIKMTGTGGILVPKGDTASRPPAVDGQFRYNTTLGQFEFYESGAWVSPTDKNTFATNLFRVYDNVDPTKQLSFDLSGITTSTTRSYVLQDADGIIPLLESAQSFTGVNTFTQDVLMVGTGQFQMPVGTTAQRSGTPILGMTRYNTDLSIPEIYDGGFWVPLSAATSIVGPAGATDNAVVRYDGITGLVAQDSNVIIDDTSNVSGIVNLTATGTTTLNTGLTGFAKLNSGVVSAQALVDLATEVTNTLPVANGGTESSAALTNDNIMYSQGGAIVESPVTLDAAGNMGGIANALMSGNLDVTGDMTALRLTTIGDITVGGIGQIDIPSGTTAERAAVPNAGMIRHNSTLNIFEGHDSLGWVPLGGPGVGDIVGPVASTDHGIARYDSASGKLLQDSGILIDDLDNMTAINSLTVTSITDSSTPCPSMSTVQRDLITPSIGSCVFNSDTAVLQIWTGFAWADAGGAALLSAWQSGATYPIGAFIYDTPSYKLYVSNVLHVSGATFAGDAANWNEVSDGLDNIAVATDNALTRWDGTTGDLVQDSGVLLDDTANMSGLLTLSSGKITVASTTEASLPCPVMTTVQRDLLTPVQGDCIYNSDTELQNTWDDLAWDASGNIVNAATSTDNAVARWDGATGKLIQDSSMILDDTGVLTLVNDMLMTGTGQIDIPSGTTLQRSGTPNAGMMRFNTDTVRYEGYDGVGWVDVTEQLHSALQGLTVGDDHTQYAFLAGRAGGQILYGSNLASENLEINSTSHATKGEIMMDGIHVKRMLVNGHSTGLHTGGELNINADPTKFDISLGDGHIIDSTTDALNPTHIDVTIGPFVAQTVTNIATNEFTHIYITSAGAILQSLVDPTPQLRRDNIYLGKLVHPDNINILVAASQPETSVNIGNAVTDFWKGLGPIILSGNRISANGANLSFDKSAGDFHQEGINFHVDAQSPNIENLPAQVPVTFQYRTQTSVMGGDTTLIDGTNYDNGGTVTAIGGSNNQATNQRIYLFNSGAIRVQYGQQIYSTIAAAVAGLTTEPFIKEVNIEDNAILVATISVTKGAADLSDPGDARISAASKFGEISLGTGASAVSTLQDAYNNSTQPQITLDSTRVGVQILDAAITIGGPFFEVLSNDTLTEYFKVDINGIHSTALLLPGGDVQTQLDAKEDILVKTGKARQVRSVSPGETTEEYVDVMKFNNNGLKNLFINPSAEQGSSAEWSCANGFITTSTSDAVPSEKSANNFSLIATGAGQCTFIFSGTSDVNGLIGKFTGYLKASLVDTATVDIEIDTVQQSTKKIPSGAIYEEFNMPITFGATSVEVLISYTGAVTITFDEIFVGIGAPSGTGTGQGGINYILAADYNMEDNVDNYNTYADVAGANPVDGTGGAPTITIAQSQTGKFLEENNLVLSKDAINRQGEGFSYDFTIDPMLQAQKLRVAFYFDATNANFTDDDMKIAIYDVTNAALISMSGQEDIKGGYGQFISSFQTAPDSTSYRIIFHIASTNATAYDIYFDNIEVGPQSIKYGTPQTDWKTSNITVSGVTASAEEYHEKQSGDSIEINGAITITSVASTIEFSLDDYSVDLTKLAQDTNSNTIKGEVTATDSSTGNRYAGSLFITASGSIRLVGPSSAVWNATTPFTWASGDLLGFSSDSIPIQGWSSNAQMSEDLGGRDVVLRGSGNSGAAITLLTERVDFTSIEDTTASWSQTDANGGDTFTAPESGYYSISGSLVATATVSGWSVYSYIDGAQDKRLGFLASATVVPFSGDVYLAKGQTLSITTSDTFTQNNTVDHWIHIQKRSSPQTLYETEKIVGNYSSNSGTVSINNTSSIFTYEDFIEDSHTMCTASVCTVQANGNYSICASFATQTILYAANNLVQIDIIKNSTSIKSRFLRTTASTTAYNIDTCIESYPFLKGDTFEIHARSTVTVNSSPTSPLNSFSFSRTK